MTPDERDERWLEIDRELAEIAVGKVTHGSDPAAREDELLDEQDRLEWEVGEEWLRFPCPGRC
jgi:hypothetical protein